MTDDRSAYLLDVTDNFLETHRAWVESDTPYITEDFELRADEVVEVFGQGSVPGTLRKLTEIVTGDFAPGWEEWRERAGRTGDPNQMPKDRFWKAVEDMATEIRGAKAPPVATVESIDDLVAQKVSDRQICVIYGWIDPHTGAPDFAKLREERVQPGRHTKNWVSPVEKQRQAAEAREKAIADEIAARRSRKIKTATQPSKESTEELLRQGLSASQISTMRKITVSAVMAEADRLNIPRPPINYESAHARRGRHDPDLPEAAARAFDARGKAGGGTEPKKRGRPAKAKPLTLEEELAAAVAAEDGEPAGGGFDAADEADEFERTDLGEGDEVDEAPAGLLTLEQEIISFHQQGLAPTEVAKAVSSPGAKVTAAKVRGIVKRWEDDPASIGVPAG